ncbi:MAG: CBS domain-containing protein [Acidobacteriota bacterium]|nr:CBS domain-containing protein [Acidobacteriota bacterium]
MKAMRGWSFQVGRFFGVEVRIHAFFLLLLAIAVALGSFAGANNGRVLVLWLLLLFAVAIRELARALAAAWNGLELRSILLLPTGGLMSYATLEATERSTEPGVQRRMAVVGPLASIGFGLLLGGIVLASAPGVKLVDLPLITPNHLLRAMVWLNLLLGAINLLPALPLDGGRVFANRPTNGAPEGKERRGPTGSRLGTGFALGFGGGMGQWIAIGLIVAGLLLTNLWLVIMGAFVLIGAHMENTGLLARTEVDTVRMRDVMLTQFSTLSASDTLEDALQRAVHTLQDVFPVVRGGNLVGAVSRQNILEALATSGNSYVQGVMTRSFQTALPDDSLVKTLRRIMGEEGAQLVPVMEGERIVGIVTPQNLSQSMGLLNQTKRMRRPEES